MDIIEVDGTIGGGQVLRTALALSASLGMPFVMKAIRSTRKKPGLRAQHLACVRATKQICQAEVEGDELHSQEIMFTPGKLKGSFLEIDIGTAGSISLLLQSLLLPCYFAPGPVHMKVKGGTDVPMSMPIDFMREVVCNALAKILDIRIDIVRRGYMPVGEGNVEVHIESKKTPSALHLEQRQELLCIRGISHASMDLESIGIAERQAKSAQAHLSSIKVPVSIHSEYSEASCSGSGILLTAYYGNEYLLKEEQVVVGADILGEQETSATSIGEQVVALLKQRMDQEATIDEHLADTLIPFLAMFGGVLYVGEITDHIKANMYVTELFLGDRFSVSNGVIRVDMPYVLS